MLLLLSDSLADKKFSADTLCIIKPSIYFIKKMCSNRGDGRELKLHHTLKRPPVSVGPYATSPVSIPILPLGPTTHLTSLNQILRTASSSPTWRHCTKYGAHSSTGSEPGTKRSSTHRSDTRFSRTLTRYSCPISVTNVTVMTSKCYCTYFHYCR